MCPFMTQQSQNELTLLSRHSVATPLGNKLTHNSPGNACLPLSQLAEQLWTDPWPKSGIGTNELSPRKTVFKNLKHIQGKIGHGSSNLLYNLCMQGKATATSVATVLVTK